MTATATALGPGTCTTLARLCEGLSVKYRVRWTVGSAARRVAERCAVSVQRLVLDWWDASDLAGEPAVVDPVDVLGDGDLKLVDALPRPAVADQLGLEQAVERLGGSCAKTGKPASRATGPRTCTHRRSPGRTPTSAPGRATAATSRRRCARSLPGCFSCRAPPTSTSGSPTTPPRCSTWRRRSCARSRASGGTEPATRARTPRTWPSSATRYATGWAPERARARASTAAPTGTTAALATPPDGPQAA